MKRYLVGICVVLTALVSGCARNAIIELEFSLPPASEDVGAPDTGIRYFQLEIMRAAAGLDDFISPGDGDLANERLHGWQINTPLSRQLDVMRSPMTVEVEAFDEIEAMHARLRFCTDEGCPVEENLILSDSRELWLRYEHPFFMGERTRHSLYVEAIPSRGNTSAGCAPGGVIHDQVCLISSCQIWGCVDDGSELESYCDDAVHFCDQ